jgi:hypothetical protein
MWARCRFLHPSPNFACAAVRPHPVIERNSEGVIGISSFSCNESIGSGTTVPKLL